MSTVVTRFRFAWLVIAVVLSLGATIGASGCVYTSSGRSDSDAVAWAGFVERDGLTIVTSEDTGRLDAAVDFTLKGSNGDMAAAISAAGFNTGFARGTRQVHAHLFEGKLDGLTDLESAVDTWKAPKDDLHPHVQTINRHLVRGRLGDEVFLYVSAFTT